MTATEETALSTDLVPIWQQQDEEDSIAFAKFKCYRGLPPHRRNVTAAYRAYREEVLRTESDRRGLALRAPKEFLQLAKTWMWKERALEYDRWRDETRELEVAHEVARLRETTNDLAKVMLAKVGESLGALRATIYEEITLPDGTVETRVRPGLSPSVMLQFAKTAIQIQRFALGIEEGQGGRDINVNVLNVHGTASDAQLLAEAREVMEARGMLIDGRTTEPGPKEGASGSGK